MKILVIGGTGTMGAPLVELLAEAGNYVDVLVRHEHNDHDNIHYFAGNGYDDEFLKTSILTKHYEAIVDFLWYSEYTLSSRVEDLLCACDQYICLSSAAVYADSNDMQTEVFPRFIDVLPKELVEGNHQYHLEKARVEDVMMSQSKKNWTIIRPHVTFNTGHLPLLIWDERTWLFRTFSNHSFSLPQEIMSNRTNYTYGGDVAKMILKIIGNHNAFGEIFNVVSDRIVDYNELTAIYTKILSRLGYALKVVYEPNMNDWNKAFPYCIDRIEYDRALNRVFSNDKFKRLIGNVDFEPLEDILYKCVKDCLNNWNNGENQNPWIDSLVYEDRITHDSTNINELHINKDKKDFLIKKYNFLNKAYLIIYPAYSLFFKKR